ncbi:MAG: hemolysin III family protein, partial [Promethearchaeia archaeon]
MRPPECVGDRATGTEPPDGHCRWAGQGSSVLLLGTDGVVREQASCAETSAVRKCAETEISDSGPVSAFHHRCDEPYRMANITGGYRSQGSSVWQCIASLFELHNETLNIWTHVVGAGIFVYLLIAVLTTGELSPFFSIVKPVSGLDAAVLSVYLATCIVCFILSVLFHLFTAASTPILEFFSHADHLGILVLMMGSNLPMIVYGFWHSTQLIVLHVMLCAAALALAVGLLQNDRMQPYKLRIFLGVVAIGWIQLMHDISYRGALSSVEARAAVSVWCRSFGTYSAGLFFYYFKYPERLLPGQARQYQRQQQQRPRRRRRRCRALRACRPGSSSRAGT